jgi:hypothetical protein
MIILHKRTILPKFAAGNARGLLEGTALAFSWRDRGKEEKSQLYK